MSAIYLSVTTDRQQTPIALTTPVFYWSAARFFTYCLNCSWRHGNKLVTRGVLIPDAFSDDRPLFLATGSSIARHRQAIADYRTGPKRRAKPL
jgi:hypothetical protein